MREPIVSRILRYSLYLVFMMALLITITMPMMIDTYFRWIYDVYSLRAGYRQFIMCFTMVVGFASAGALFEMILIMRSASAEPFIERNGKALKRIGIIAMLIAILFFAKCGWYVTFLTMVCGFIFLLGSLFAFTLAELFSRAVQFREENDLTI